MLIGIVGTLCSGKHTTAEYLVQQHGFLRLHLPSKLTIASEGSDDWKRLLPSITDEKGTRGLTFPDVDSLLEFVTKRWREHWVLTDIHDEETLDMLLRRPFFLLLSIDAPVSLRYFRFNNRSTKRGLEPVPMERFIHINDTILYGSSTSAVSTGTSTSIALQHSSLPTQHTSSSSSPASHAANTWSTGTAQLQSRAHVQILNHNSHHSHHQQQQPSASIAAYYSLLDTLDLPSPTRLRPPWDAYFMHLARLASLRSNCMKRRVGCVLVLHNRILSTGYNGTPRNLPNCNEGGCARCNVGAAGGNALSTCLCLHAEENALLEAGRERIREGAVLYCDTCPCLTCSVKIAQVGVKEVVYSQSYNMDEASRKVLAEAGVRLRQYSPPKSELVGLGSDMGAGGETHSVTPTLEHNLELIMRNGGAQ